MDMPLFEVTAWDVPHSAYGRILWIDTEYEDGRGYGIYSQSLSLKSGTSWHHPELDLDQPYTFRPLAEDWILRFAAALDGTTLSFGAQPFKGMFGGTTFGLRIARGMQEITVRWQPRFDDQTEQIRNLWRLLDQAAGSHAAELDA